MSFIDNKIIEAELFKIKDRILCFVLGFWCKQSFKLCLILLDSSLHFLNGWSFNTHRLYKLSVFSIFKLIYLLSDVFFNESFCHWDLLKLLLRHYYSII